MINIDKVPRSILEAAAKNLGWREGDYRKDYRPEDDPIEPYLKRLAAMSPERVFECYCTWHGFIGWHVTLWAAVESLQDAGNDE